MTSFAGIFPIVNTTFNEDGTLDLESQRRLVRFLIDCGAHGLGLFGNASEGYALAEDERRQLTAGRSSRKWRAPCPSSSAAATPARTSRSR